MIERPGTMSGVVLTGHGGLDRLEWRDDLPKPIPGRGEVLIRVLASAVNNTDINTRIGWYSKAVRGDTEAAVASAGEDGAASGSWTGAPLAFPLVQGADCCGEIVQVGEGVDRTRLGERVLVRALQSVVGDDGRPRTITFGSEHDGAFAQFTLAASSDAVAVSSDLSDVELASFPCAFSTAEGMVQRSRLGAERVLVTGASGGVGSAAIQLAKRRGAHVTALTSADKAEELRRIGADDILNRHEPFPDDAFDVVLDLVGGPRWPELLGSLESFGRYVAAGAIAGPIVELDLRTLYLKDLSLLGSTNQPENVFTDLVRYIEAGEIRPTVAKSYPLRDIRAAQTAFLEKRHVGKIGLVVADG
ncbi:alcohol dehydrogenase family protein [Jiella avicenniae]|uniref:Alcohol dehydrogenase family protein n=1 Tax=Jiella avicenniae TaxID=2907202 RepID=A0A9X1T5K0_9HYPH|nr:alcohol dehydrogenase family protein [Jiella avicenniae]MCE7029292.1 alcohol dehydrogenase family protein [Jiella avicenniae]